MSIFMKQKQISIARGKNRGKGQSGMYTLLCFKWITNAALLYSRGNSAKCYVAAWRGGEFGEWIHVYVWLRPFAVHLKLSQHCESAITKHKIKRFLKNKFFLFLRQPVIFYSFQFNTCSDQCCHGSASLTVVCLPSLHLVVVLLLSFTWQSMHAPCQTFRQIRNP